jgi:hypothetical protein
MGFGLKFPGRILLLNFPDKLVLLFNSITGVWSTKFNYYYLYSTDVTDVTDDLVVICFYRVIIPLFSEGRPLQG